MAETLVKGDGPVKGGGTDVKAAIPAKTDRAANRKKKDSKGGRPVGHDADLYKERNAVERLTNNLKAWRGIATRVIAAWMTPVAYDSGIWSVIRPFEELRHGWYR